MSAQTLGRAVSFSQSTISNFKYQSHSITASQTYHNAAWPDTRAHTAITVSWVGVLLKVCVWDLAAHCLKANEHVRLVERNVCFISDAGNWGGVGEGGRHLSKGRLAPDKQGVSAFIESRGGLRAETALSSLTSSANRSSVVWPASSWLFQVQLNNLRLQVHLFPFLCGQFSELWQLMSCVQSGPHGVNSPPGVSVSLRQLTGHSSEHYLQAQREN